MYVKLRKAVGQSGVGPHWWENDGDVVEVPVDLAQELLDLRTGGFSLVFDEPEEPATEESPESKILDGPAHLIVDWVRGNPERIKIALKAERDKGDKARSSLISKLESMT